MTDIKEITKADRKPDEVIADLKKKTVTVRGWSDLEKEYDPKKHPVMTDPNYVDKVVKGKIEKVTRIAIGLQRLATKRMTELAFGIPVKRTYDTDREGELTASKVLERIYQRNRIDSFNIERGKLLWAGCELCTLWYAQEEPNTLYGVNSPIKLRCKNYSPMLGDSLYPLFDDMDDMIAMSIGYSRNENGVNRDYFDTYTKDEHIRWEANQGKWEETIREPHGLGKIPAIYIHRPTPIWEDTSNDVFELEWTFSRNGNYIRKNSKPIYNVFSNENIAMGNESDDDFRSVFQYPEGASAGYATWPQATDSLKFQVAELYKIFFTELQLPDISYESMKTTPMSGEARKMMFLDAQMKVIEESGRWLEFLDREANVLRAFLKTIMPKAVTDIDTLPIETTITPYAITEEKETIANLMMATGGKAILSQAEGVRRLGWSEDPDKTIQELKDESMIDIAEPTI